jgi:cellulose synthase/poly-beta-1,6-N-acetylglucosamine synthase-like glycosyltransferase
VTTAIHVTLLALAVPATFCASYLLLLTLLSRAPAPTRRSSRNLNFDVVVPAHNEAPAIADVIASLRQLDWPEDRFRILVVADNCTDSTATLARAAGATVLERHDSTRRGKGHALAAAFQASHECNRAHAVVVVDADSAVSPNLLEAFAVRIEQGARAMQAHYDVLNAQDSWRTRLLTIAMSCFHRVRSRAREQLRLSCGIRGNGWCITRDLLLRAPYEAFSLTEDIEYGIDLGMAGERVHYIDEARVSAAMVSGEQAARSQRQRWESGRWQLICSRVVPLLRSAFRRPSRVCADLAMDLLIPPLAQVAVVVMLLVILAGIAGAMLPATLPWLWIGLGCAFALALYVLRGWQLSGVGMRGLLDLARAPAFVVWKIALLIGAKSPTEWVRTGREPR